jgi:hypothetical protein
VLAGVLLHVDLADGDRHECLECVAHGAGRTRQGEHRTVVAGIARPVEEMDAGHAGDRLRHSIDDRRAATFGHVRDGLDETGRESGRQIHHAGIVPRSEGRNEPVCGVPFS